MSTAPIRVDLQLIADMVQPGGRALDVGCGDGSLLAYLVNFKRVDARGLELSRANIRNALKKVNELQWRRDIKPFVVDYDEAATMLHIVDKGYYIWRKRQEIPELLQHIGLNTQRTLPRRRSRK